MKRWNALLALAVLLAGMATAPAWYRGRYYGNTYTGGFARGGIGYNPMTGGYYRGMAGYNPYTGRDLGYRTYYNPMTNTYRAAAGAYNPYTGYYGYRTSWAHP
jgi:hypothetical protein